MHRVVSARALFEAHNVRGVAIAAAAPLTHTDIAACRALVRAGYRVCVLHGDVSPAQWHTFVDASVVADGGCARAAAAVRELLHTARADGLTLTASATTTAAAAAAAASMPAQIPVDDGSGLAASVSPAMGVTDVGGDGAEAPDLPARIAQLLRVPPHQLACLILPRVREGTPATMSSSAPAVSLRCWQSVEAWEACSRALLAASSGAHMQTCASTPASSTPPTASSAAVTVIVDDIDTAASPTASTPSSCSDATPAHVHRLSAATLSSFVAQAVGHPRALDMEYLGFGPNSVHRQQVFYFGERCIAFVNLKPVVPGHCLVISRRRVPRFASLSSDEVAEAWGTAQRLSHELERVHKCSSITFALQDGPAAGQTVPHVHIHMLPRKADDMPHGDNDEVYGLIDDSEEAHTPAPGGVHAHTRGGIAVDPLGPTAVTGDAATGLRGEHAPSAVDAAIVNKVPLASGRRSMDDMAAEAASYRPLFASMQQQAWALV